jgi:hypothetical protein
MTETGYHWSIAALDEGWLWRLADRETGQILIEGSAPSRPVAAAMVVREIARGMTPAQDRSIAA